MEISKYEAASWYDFEQQNLSSEKDYLVIDLDDSSCGYCTCTIKRNIKLNAKWKGDNDNLWIMFIDSIKEFIEDLHFIDIEDEVEKQILYANKAFQNYFISDKAFDAEAFSFLDSKISCAQLENATSNFKEKLLNLLSNAVDMVPEEKMLDINIVILGKAQELYLTMYYIREYISFDPMLPDKRFRNTEFKDSYTEIVKIGKELYESKPSLSHKYSVLAFDSQSNSFGAIYTVQKENANSLDSDIVFSEPILLCDGDKISVKADDSVLSITLPYTFAPLKSDLVNIAIGLDNNEDTLFIRRCRFPTRIYNVKLY